MDLRHELYVSSSGGWDSLQEYDLSGSVEFPVLVSASINDFGLSGSLSLNNIPNFEKFFLQRDSSYSSSNQNTLAGVSLQRFNVYSDKIPATIVWLMRARNTENTRYIYWRSIGSPSSFGISGIILNSVETIGSVYEQV